MQKYNSTKHGVADYNRFVQIPKADWDDILQEDDDSVDYKDGKYAILSYQVNQVPITLSGDIQLGSVELSDAETEDRVNIEQDVDKNAMYIQSESLASESTLSGVITSIETTPLLGYAEPNIPTQSVSGDIINVWVDDYGRQVIFGANLSLNAIDVNTINDSTLSRLGPIINLDDIDKDALGAGSTIDVSNYHNFTIHIQSSNITTGTITISVESSLDDIHWATIAEEIISTNDVTEISISQQSYRYLRTNALSVDITFDGAINTLIYAGN